MSTTYKPNRRKRKKIHGFRARKKKGDIVQQRRRKGRKQLTV